MAGKYTEAQKSAIYKYLSAKCRLSITIEKEERERWKAEAEKAGLSLTEYIRSKVNNTQA